MKCPGCGSRVFVDVGIHGAQDLLVEVASGKYHDSARCHAADPVRRAAPDGVGEGRATIAADPLRRAAREYLDARDVVQRAWENGLAADDIRFHHAALDEKAKLAALRAAMEG